jgi:phage-related protein
VTNAFRKKSQKLPEEEKEQAQLAMQNYTERVLKDAYYEKD